MTSTNKTVEIKRLEEEICNDGFERYSLSFNVGVEDFKDIEFPCGVKVTHQASDHFDWVSYNYEIIEGDLCKTPEELVEFLSSFRDKNYDDGSHQWTEETFMVKISMKEFKVKCHVIMADAQGHSRVEGVSVNTPLTRNEAVQKARVAIQLPEFKELLDSASLNPEYALQQLIRKVGK